MKLISFDVGIKNMAYCIFDISGQLSITGWNVLNLLEEEPTTEICSQIIPAKTKKVLPKSCTKPAKYKKNGKCYCSQHAESSTFIIPNKKNSMVSLKKLKVDDLIKLGHSLFLFMDAENIPKLKKDILDKLGEFYEKNNEFIGDKPISFQTWENDESGIKQIDDIHSINECFFVKIQPYIICF
jgi:hypothetical protein